MAYTPVKTSFENNYKELRLGGQIPFMGLNICDMDTSIADGQSPYMVNVNLYDGGKPTKRKGQTFVLLDSLGNSISHGVGGMNGYYPDLYKGKHVYAWGSGLYTYDESTHTETQIYSGLTNARGEFYNFNDIIFYKNGSQFIKWDGLTAVDVLTTAYIPTVAVGCPPTGGGTVSEKKNLIQPAFKQTFNADGTSTVFTLSYQNLDSTTVKVTVGGTIKTEGTDFTVDRSLGKVYFPSGSPPPSGINNVVITAYKTITGDKEKILKSKLITLFGGGTNDSRLFCAGSPDYPNIFWYTGLTGNTMDDSTYFPDTYFNRIGSDAKAITGWSYLYSKLIALKEDGLYMISYSNDNGIVSFPVSIMNRQVGCDMPGSVQIIKNYPIFCNSKSGLYMIVSTLIESEKNVEQISRLVNTSATGNIPGLLDNAVSDLQDCSSLNNGKKYYLRIGTSCYVWDYEKASYQGDQNNLVWYYYTGIYARKWASINRDIYYARFDTGQLVKFQDAKNDFGTSINSAWRSKLFNFGLPDMLKTIYDMWLSTRADAYNEIDIAYYTERNEKTEAATAIIASFSLAKLDLSKFTVGVVRFPPTIKKKPKLNSLLLHAALIEDPKSFLAVWNFTS